MAARVAPVAAHVAPVAARAAPVASRLVSAYAAIKLRATENISAFHISRKAALIFTIVKRLIMLPPPGARDYLPLNATIYH